MRTNGLTASAYTPIADVDPRIVGPLLEELKEHGVAAYVTPVESTSMGALDRPEFRTEVKDRLYVDAASADSARELLAAVNDEIDTSGDDLAWAQIVSGYDRPLTDEGSPWPASENVGASDPTDGDADSDEPGHDDRPGRRTPADIVDARHIVSGPPPREDEEHERFVPPTPPPLPRLEPHKQLAWVGVVGGPALLLAAVLFSIRLPGWLSTLAVGGFMIGFVALVVMMGKRDNDDDPGGGWDDGAVV